MNKECEKCLDFESGKQTWYNHSCATCKVREKSDMATHTWDYKKARSYGGFAGWDKGRMLVSCIFGCGATTIEPTPAWHSELDSICGVYGPVYGPCRLLTPEEELKRSQILFEEDNREVEYIRDSAYHKARAAEFNLESGLYWIDAKNLQAIARYNGGDMENPMKKNWKLLEGKDISFSKIGAFSPIRNPFHSR